MTKPNNKVPVYSIVRGDRSGVYFGVVKSVSGPTGQTVKLARARNLYYWDGAASVMQMALTGVTNPDACKFTVVLDSITLLDVIQICPCTPAAAKSLAAVKDWKR